MKRTRTHQPSTHTKSAAKRPTLASTFWKSVRWGLFLSVFLLLSCHSTPTVSPEEQMRRDSAALHVAVMPTADCLPLYMAQRTGLFDSVGVDVRLLTYQAQIDIDTALAKGHVELAYSDLIRAIMMQQDTVGLYAVAAADADLTLITARRGRVRKLSQLKERMVAIARHSITDYWSDCLTDSASLVRDYIFRPQINSLRIRRDMILNNTMDAAFFPEPYATQLRLQGNQSHLSTRGQSPRLGAWLIPVRVSTDTVRMTQVKLLWQAYNRAADRLNAHSTDSLNHILHGIYGVPDSLCDTISLLLPHFTHIGPPQQSDADAALQWLKGRNQCRKGYLADTLIGPTRPAAPTSE